MTLSLYNYTGKIPGFHQQQFLIGVENKIELGLYCTNCSYFCWIFLQNKRRPEECRASRPLKASWPPSS